MPIGQGIHFACAHYIFAVTEKLSCHHNVKIVFYINAADWSANVVANSNKSIPYSYENIPHKLGSRPIGLLFFRKM